MTMEFNTEATLRRIQSNKLTHKKEAPKGTHICEENVRIITENTCATITLSQTRSHSL